MNKSITIGKILNIPIRLHWSLPIPLLILVLTMTSTEGWPKALVPLITVPIAFIIVTLHELGHSLAAKYYQMEVDSITLTGIGGIAKIHHLDQCSPIQGLVISIAGPLVNILLALIGLAFIGIPNLQHITEFLANPLTGWNGIYGLTFVINAVILAFNLIPTYPMDGGRVVQYLGEIFFGKKIGIILSLIACAIVGIPIAAFLASKQAVFPATIIGIMAFIGITENIQNLQNNKIPKQEEDLENFLP